MDVGSAPCGMRSPTGFRLRPSPSPDARSSGRSFAIARPLPPRSPTRRRARHTPPPLPCYLTTLAYLEPCSRPSSSRRPDQRELPYRTVARIALSDSVPRCSSQRVAAAHVTAVADSADPQAPDPRGDNDAAARLAGSQDRRRPAGPHAVARTGPAPHGQLVSTRLHDGRPKVSSVKAACFTAGRRHLAPWTGRCPSRGGCRERARRPARDLYADQPAFPYSRHRPVQHHRRAARGATPSSPPGRFYADGLGYLAPRPAHVIVAATPSASLVDDPPRR